MEIPKIIHLQGNGNTKILRVDHDFCSWSGCVEVFYEVLADHSAQDIQVIEYEHMEINQCKLLRNNLTRNIND